MQHSPFISTFISFLLLVSTSNASAVCDVSVYSTKFPFMDQTSVNIEEPMCLEHYFKLRSLMKYSLNEEPSQIVRANPMIMIPDDNQIYFYDFLLIDVENASLLETDDGMEELIEYELSKLLLSLKHEGRHCDLRLFSGDRKLNLDDFSREPREDILGEGKAAKGRGLIINGKDFEEPRWELQCQNSSKEYEMHSSGNYFFLYGSVYQNPVGNAFANGLHQMKYLIRLQNYSRNQN